MCVCEWERKSAYDKIENIYTYGDILRFSFIWWDYLLICNYLLSLHFRNLIEFNYMHKWALWKVTNIKKKSIQTSSIWIIFGTASFHQIHNMYYVVHIIEILYPCAVCQYNRSMFTWISRLYFHSNFQTFSQFYYSFHLQILISNLSHPSSMKQFNK